MINKIRKLISRAMEDVRGLDARYPEGDDAEGLVDALNGILENTVDEVREVIGTIRVLDMIDVIDDSMEELERLTIESGKLRQDIDYWRERSRLLERCRDESPCDSDITTSQIEAELAYKDFIKKNGAREYDI